MFRTYDLVESWHFQGRENNLDVKNGKKTVRREYEIRIITNNKLPNKVWIILHPYFLEEKKKRKKKGILKAMQ